MKRIVTCLVLVIMFFSFPTRVQAALNVRVGLIWQLAGETYLGFEAAQGTYRLTVDDGKLARSAAPGTEYRAASSPWGLMIFEQGQPLGVFTKLKLEPVTGKLPVFKLYSVKGSRKYRGSLEITRRSDGSLLVVNTLGEQEYLYGVVPMEMSNSWAAQGAEALKAQAVAARTYLYTHYDSKQTKGYNISDSPNVDQAYAGYGAEGVASAAVEATAGEILVDRDTQRPINTSYHAHSGGHTEDSEHVWGGVDPHLRGKTDPYSLGQGALPDHWTYTASAIALGRPLGLGPVVDIKLEKYPSGRVKTVRVKDIFGENVTMSGRRFVGLYYPKNRGITQRDFLGNLFDIRILAKGQRTFEFPDPLKVFLENQEQVKGPRLDRLDTSVTAPAALPNPYPVYVISGSGWGHGVGMSQWGAYGMAKAGYTYRQILEYYYTKVKVIKAAKTG